MIIEDIRRTNLHLLASEFGGVGKLANLLGKDQSQVSQWLNGSKNSGTGKPRGMKSDTCRYIEEKSDKPTGWMDRSHNETKPKESRVFGSMKEINDIRLENLQHLINEAGTQENLSDACGVSRIYLNQIKQQRTDPATGKARNIGNSVARRLEKGMNKPYGWMDQSHKNTDFASLLVLQHPSLSFENIKQDLGDWIKAAREYANLTQTNIGDLIGRTKANVSSMETGKHDPSYLQLLKIAQATKYPVPFPGIERSIVTSDLGGDFVHFLYHPETQAMMEESTKRLYAIAAKHQNKDKINQAELAREFNVSSQSVNNWEKRGVPHSIAVEAEEKFGASPSWIIKGIEIDKSQIIHSGKNSRAGYIRLDYLDVQSSAGPGKVADAYPPLIQNLNVLEDWALQSFGKNAVEKIKIINNSGDSMSPTIQDGDILFVDISRRAFEAEGIYVLDWNGRLLTKRLVAQQDGRLAVISDNPSYHPEYINEKNIDSLVICGQVRGWWSFKRF